MELEILHSNIVCSSVYVMVLTLMLLAVAAVTTTDEHSMSDIDVDTRKTLKREDKVFDIGRLVFEIANVILHLTGVVVSSINVFSGHASSKAIINWPLDIFFLAVAIFAPLVAERYIRKKRG